MFIQIIKMLYYDRLDVSEGIDVNEQSASKECDIFLSYSFKFQPNVGNRCHDLSMSLNLSDIAVLNVKGPSYHCLLAY